MVTVPSRLEFHLADGCNLHCSGCNHFSDVVVGGIVSLEEVREQLEPWSKRIDIQELSLLGGEPSLNPNLPQIADLARSLFPTTPIVMDNGIVVFDDYHDIGGGERRAVDEFLQSHGNELLFAGPTEQVFFFKGRKLTSLDCAYLLAGRGDTNRPISLLYLNKNREYLRDLATGNHMKDLPGGSLKQAAVLARKTLDVFGYHEAILRQLVP